METIQMDEIDALVGILNEDIHVESETRLLAYVTAEHNPDTEQVGALVLEVQIPSGYPGSEAVQVLVQSVFGHQNTFKHRDPMPVWSPQPDQIIEITNALNELIESRKGECLIYDLIAATKEWLEEHTLKSKGEDEMEIDSDSSEEDLRLNDEDMDDEMLEAMGEVLRGCGKLMKMLEQAERMKSGSKEQKELMHTIWMSMTDQQRQEMVASDDESSDEEIAPTIKVGALVAKVKCSKGHSPSGGVIKPEDYKKYPGSVGCCDMCGNDFKYTAGAFHCNICKDWDCCLHCGTGNYKPVKSKKGKR